MIDHNDEREYLCFRCDGIDGAHEDVGNDEDCYKAEMQAVDQNHFKAMRYTLVITIVTVTIISTIIRNVMGPECDGTCSKEQGSREQSEAQPAKSPR